jgi:hypothetical protein
MFQRCDHVARIRRYACFIALGCEQDTHEPQVQRMIATDQVRFFRRRLGAVIDFLRCVPLVAQARFALVVWCSTPE